METTTVQPEEWKIIPGFENYSASTLGRVRRERPGMNAKPGVIKKPQHNKKTGYYHLKVSGSEGKRSMSLHRIIATTWIPNPEAKKEVDHVDRDKANNSIANLRWCTRQENIINYAGYRGKGIIATSPDGEEMAFDTIRACAIYLGVFAQGICNVLHKKQYTHYKKWKFRYKHGE